MFLQRRSAALHPLGGGRSVVPADGPEVAALRALLAATSHAAVQNVLAAQLTSPVANELKQRLLARVAEYVESLKFGEPVRYAEVIFAMMSESGVTDVVDLRLLRFPPLNPQAADPVRGYQRMELGVSVQIAATQIPVAVNDDRGIILA